MVPATPGPDGSPAYFSNRNRRTSPFWVQCSSPRIAQEGVTGLFMLGLRAFGRTRNGAVGWVELLRTHRRRLMGFAKPAKSIRAFTPVFAGYGVYALVNSTHPTNAAPRPLSRRRLSPGAPIRYTARNKNCTTGGSS